MYPELQSCGLVHLQPPQIVHFSFAVVSRLQKWRSICNIRFAGRLRVLNRRSFSPASTAFGNPISDYSVNKPGVDIGVGMAFGSKWRGKFFGEAHYDRVFDNNHYHTNFLPVTFGYRW
jgi:hypothetical protein